MDVGMIIVEQLGAKFVLRRSCEMSVSLFRIKNLKFRIVLITTFSTFFFRDRLIVLTCIFFYNVCHLQLRMRRRTKKMKSFHRFVF